MPAGDRAIWSLFHKPFWRGAGKRDRGRGETDLERHKETWRDPERHGLTGTRLERDTSVWRGMTERDIGRNAQREGDGERQTQINT